MDEGDGRGGQGRGGEDGEVIKICRGRKGCDM